LPVGKQLVQIAKENMMRSKLAFTLTAIALIGLAASLVAQQPGGQRGPGGPGGGRGGPGGGGGFGQSRMSLLRIADVRKELELADEQVAAIEKIDQELREKYPFGGGRGAPGGPGGTGGKGGDAQKGRRGGNGEGALVVPTEWYFVQQTQNQNQPGQGRRGGFQPPTPEEQAQMEKQRLERSREERAKLAEVLLPQQLKRLNEIFIQQNGVNALQDDDIAKELGISDAQKAKLTEVRQANQQAMGEQMRTLFQGGGGGGDRDAARAKMEEIRKTNDAKLLAVLSPDQQKKFEEMKGKPFAMPEGAGRGGPGGPGGQGGNRGRGNRGGNNNP